MLLGGPFVCSYGGTVSFEPPDISLGVVEGDGGTLQGSVLLRNHSNEPLEILVIRPSCLCLKVSPDKTSVPPGGAGKFYISAVPPYQRGDNAQTIFVSTSTGDVGLTVKWRWQETCFVMPDRLTFEVWDDHPLKKEVVVLCPDGHFVVDEIAGTLERARFGWRSCTLDGRVVCLVDVEVLSHSEDQQDSPGLVTIRGRHGNTPRTRTIKLPVEFRRKKAISAEPASFLLGTLADAQRCFSVRLVPVRGDGVVVESVALPPFLALVGEPCGDSFSFGIGAVPQETQTGCIKVRYVGRSEVTLVPVLLMKGK